MDLQSLLRSVVGVRAHIPEDAFTASGLGVLREGSGVLIRESGLVLTIGYLITEASEVWLTTSAGRVVPAHALAYDQETGFGLVQALARLELPAMELGESGKAHMGDGIVLADGTGNFVEGAIVARQEFAGYWEYLLDDAIFTAPAHESWGGAALISQDGKLIGIGSLRLQMMRAGEVADINMSVPIDLLNPILDDMLTRGQANRPPRPWLGVFSAENNGQVVVMSVSENGPAAKAGSSAEMSSPTSATPRSRASRTSTASSGPAARPAPRSPSASSAMAATPGSGSRPPTATPSCASRSCSSRSRQTSVRVRRRYPPPASSLRKQGSSIRRALG